MKRTRVYSSSIPWRTRRALLLLRHGSAAAEEPRSLTAEGVAEAEDAGDGLLAYLELKSKWQPKLATGEPVAVKILHSGKDRAAQTAFIVHEKLKSAGCGLAEPIVTADELKPNADPAAAVALLADPVSAPPLTVMVGHLPLLHKLAAALGVEVNDTCFTPAGGLLLVNTEGSWSLAHVVNNRRNWWMRGVSIYVSSTDGEPPRRRASWSPSLTQESK